MIIRNHTTKETATRSSLNNRGYERSEHPRITSAIVASTLKECPNSLMGDPFRVDVPLFAPIRGYCAPPVIERRRFQRLCGTIADNHFTSSIASVKAAQEVMTKPFIYMLCNMF